jgi:hypothetical protein
MSKRTYWFHHEQESRNLYRGTDSQPKEQIWGGTTKMKSNLLERALCVCVCVCVGGGGGKQIYLNKKSES